jgi:putative peptidoglycan lipid II flippase
MISRLLSKVSAGSPNAKIFRAGITVSALGAVATAATAIKELTLARYFGRNDAIDAFFIAYLLPSFVVSLVVGSLGAALIPVFVEVRRHRGEAPAQELFSGVLFLNLVVLLVVATVLGLLSPYYLPYLGAGFSVEKLKTTRELLLSLLPFIVFNGTALSITAVLNAGERFALPAMVPLITPAAVILFIVLAAGRWGAFAIVAGTLLGSFLEAATLAWTLQRHGIRFQFKWKGLTPDIRSVIQQFSPMIAGSFLIGSTLVVDKSMAAMLPGGSVAALSYANKIVSGVVVIGAAALSTATFPYFSRMVSDKDWAGCRKTLKKYSVWVGSVSVLLTLFLIAFSKPIVRILFQRGAFTAVDTELVNRVQICYLIQVPFYTVGMLFVRFLSAARRNEVLMYGAAMSLVLDIVLNLAFMRYWGAAGIALSTSVVYCCTFLYLLAFSRKLLGESQEVPGAHSMAANATYPE